MFGEQRSRWQPQSPGKVLEKHPCSRGAGHAWVWQQSLQEMWGCSSVLAGFLGKWHKCRGGEKGKQRWQSSPEAGIGESSTPCFLSTGRAVARGGHRGARAQGSVILWFVQMILRNSFCLSAKAWERFGLPCFLLDVLSQESKSHETSQITVTVAFQRDLPWQISLFWGCSPPSNFLDGAKSVPEAFEVPSCLVFPLGLNPAAKCGWFWAVTGEQHTTS